MVVGSPFLIAGGDAAALLEPIDQPLDSIAFAIGRAVEARGAAFVHLAGNHRPNPALAQRLPHRPRAVALVADQPPRPQPRAPTPGPLDRAPARQRWERHLVVALPTGQGEDDRLALALGPDVDLGAEAAPRTAQRFARGVPPFAPAAC